MWWPFLLLVLLIYLIIIVISVCAYPSICSGIVVACKRYNVIVTGLLLLLTTAFYIFACKTLEDSFDNWCYSVYAGIVLTPIFLLFSTESDEPGRWKKSGEKAQHSILTIPILTFLTSLLFTTEGVLRMAHSYSVHRMINYGWRTLEIESYRSYHDEFQYAGILLFIVSLFSALISGYIIFLVIKNFGVFLLSKQKRNLV